LAKELSHDRLGVGGILSVDSGDTVAAVLALRVVLLGADEVEAIKAAGDNRTKRTTQHKQQVAKKARQEQVDALAAGLTSPPPPAAQPAVTPATVPAGGMAQAIADAAL
jgi:hypothetical protein